MEVAHPAMSTSPTKPRVIIHGGAGNITRDNLPLSSYAAYRSALLDVLNETHLCLQTGTSALDAATFAVALLEDNPLFNCGRGAVFTRAGTIELEASLMVSRGYRKRGVGVSLLKKVKNPIKLAREMLVRGETDGDGGPNGGGSDPSGGAGGAQGHCHLSGATAEDLARAWGLDMCDEKYHWTKKRWDEHRKGLAAAAAAAADPSHEWADGSRDPGWDGHEYLPQGTVGAVCLDRHGVLCVATSTGGLTNKLPGRIGDTPTHGAGFWAEEWRLPRPPPRRRASAVAPLAALLPPGVWQGVACCLPGFVGFTGGVSAAELEELLLEEKASSHFVRAVAMSGTGNGDSFLRLAAARTAASVARFSRGRSLASAVRQVAGSGGELQKSAGDRWGRTGEGEGTLIL